MKNTLSIIAAGQSLTRAQAEEAMHCIMKGEAEPEVIAGFLLGLRSRGETLDELVGFTKVMREYAVPVELDDPDAIDLCGTGGDQRGTFNISTTAAFVCAGAGVTVAKHGNRSISSKCGSADVLASLGVEIELGKEGVEYCLKQTGMAFIFAPFFHPAMRYVMPVRKKLGVRTFFNILGPMCNPAGVRRQLVGAFSLDVAEMMAQVLKELDAASFVTVHAEDGLDECSLAAPTTLFSHDARHNAGPVKSQIGPGRFGLNPAPLAALEGDTAAENADIIRKILNGQAGPHRDIVVMNAALALSTSGRYPTLDACFEAAIQSIDSGAAREALNRLTEASQQAPTAKA